jgi:hypothetical protein
MYGTWNGSKPVRSVTDCPDRSPSDDVGVTYLLLAILQPHPQRTGS